ncbi:hypothetical protein AVEN_213963-1 [Araneus ventricosus]|uniref:Uncharacterized protein n=1 Tax=Araneus ventricosus TaxID=182803 RepID=A0A4Y2MU96_ARAVE|nr:hypothetical protein AVEN_213963-1 [Araneus ventricosus]
MARTSPELAPPLQTSAQHQREDVWPPTHVLRLSVYKRPHHTSGRSFDPRPDLACTRHTYTADFESNRVSNQELSGLEAETLPLSRQVHESKIQHKG